MTADEAPALCACGNHARYVDEDGRLTCALCPLRAGKDSIRLADVPRLLKWARDVVGLNSVVGYADAQTNWERNWERVEEDGKIRVLPKRKTDEFVLHSDGLSALRGIIGRRSS